MIFVFLRVLLMEKTPHSGTAHLLPTSPKASTALHIKEIPGGPVNLEENTNLVDILSIVQNPFSTSNSMIRENLLDY